MTLTELQKRTERATKVHDDIVKLKQVPMNPPRVSMTDGMERKDFLSDDLLREVFKAGVKDILEKREMELQSLLLDSPPQEASE